jgi:hypothetical protein
VTSKVVSFGLMNHHTLERSRKTLRMPCCNSSNKPSLMSSYQTHNSWRWWIRLTNRSCWTMRTWVYFKVSCRCFKTLLAHQGLWISNLDPIWVYRIRVFTLSCFKVSNPNTSHRLSIITLLFNKPLAHHTSNRYRSPKSSKLQPQPLTLTFRATTNNLRCSLKDQLPTTAPPPLITTHLSPPLPAPSLLSFLTRGSSSRSLTHERQPRETLAWNFLW